MFRQPSARNQKSKGIKVKHVLQICFLLAICFWLMYQVKHSHDKKALDDNDANQSLNVRSSSDVLKLGRKDLTPKQEQQPLTNGKPHEETEEEDAVGDEEDNKNEEVIDEDPGEKEDEGGGDAVDEMDEHELDKSDAEVDIEDVTEEEKDQEENDESEDNEKGTEDHSGSTEDGNSSKDHEVEDEVSKSSHEAREEHYKADDASSAVTQTSQVIASENAVESSTELGGKDSLADENPINSTLRTEGRGIAETGSHIDTIGHDALENVVAKTNASSLPADSAFIEQSHGFPQVTDGTTMIDGGSRHPSVHNGTEILSDGSHLENVTTEGINSADISGSQTTPLDQLNNASFSSSKNEAGSNLESSSEAHDSGSSSRSDVPLISEKSISTSEETERTIQPLDIISNNKTEAIPDTDAKASTTEGIRLSSEIANEVQEDPIDSSDSSTNLEEKDDQMDMDTLANVLNEDSDEEAASE